MADSYTLRDLIAAASASERLSLSERAVRQYVAEGLIPPPRGQGITATYTQEHLTQLRIVLRLVNQYVPLQEIGHWLEGVGAPQVQALLDRPAVPRLPVEGDAQAYLSRLLKSLPPAPVPPTVHAAHTQQSRRSAIRQMLQAPAPAALAMKIPNSGGETWLHISVTADIVLMVRQQGPAANAPDLDRVLAAVHRALTNTVPEEG